MASRNKCSTMTPSKQAKAIGLESLALVSEMTGKSRSTLYDWAKNNPKLFKIVLTGCLFTPIDKD